MFLGREALYQARLTPSKARKGAKETIVNDFLCQIPGKSAGKAVGLKKREPPHTQRRVAGKEALP